MVTPTWPTYQPFTIGYVGPAGIRLLEEYRSTCLPTKPSAFMYVRVWPTSNSLFGSYYTIIPKH